MFWMVLMAILLPFSIILLSNEEYEWISFVTCNVFMTLTL